MLISLRNLQGSIAFSLGVSTMVLIHAAHYAIFALQEPLGVSTMVFGFEDYLLLFEINSCSSLRNL